MAAQPGNARRPVEEGHFRFDSELESQGCVRPVALDGHLRHPPVGLVLRRDRRIKGLVIFDAHQRGPRAVEKLEVRVAAEVRLARTGEAARQVLEVRGVGDVRRVNRGAPPGGQLRLVEPADTAAVVAGNVVIRQEIAREHAVGPPGQVAELGIGLEPTTGHVVGRQGCVVVWCEIQVVGQCDFDAALAAVAHVRQEEARFPPVIYGVGQVGGIEDRHTLEFKARVSGRPCAGFAIDME